MIATRSAARPKTCFRPLWHRFPLEHSIGRQPSLTSIWPAVFGTSVTLQDATEVLLLRNNGFPIQADQVRVRLNIEIHAFQVCGPAVGPKFSHRRCVFMVGVSLWKNR